MSEKRYYLTTGGRVSDMPYSTPASAIDLASVAEHIVDGLCQYLIDEPDDGPMHEAIRKAWAIVHIAELEAKVRSYGEEP